MCDIAIQDFETISNERGEYTAYILRIIYGAGAGSSYSLKKRFSDFENLHWELREALENSGFDVDLPMLPPKKFCGSMEPEFVQQRLWQLQEYTKELLRVPGIIDVDPFLKFISVEGDIEGVRANIEAGQHDDALVKKTNDT